MPVESIFYYTKLVSFNHHFEDNTVPGIFQSFFKFLVFDARQNSVKRSRRNSILNFDFMPGEVLAITQKKIEINCRKRKFFFAKCFAKVYNISSRKTSEPGYKMEDKMAELIK